VLPAGTSESSLMIRQMPCCVTATQLKSYLSVPARQVDRCVRRTLADTRDAQPRTYGLDDRLCELRLSATLAVGER
jgi:hypothetical protein